MNAIVHPTATAIDALEAQIDTMLGLPREGVDVGGGIHAGHDKARGIGWTLHHAWRRVLPDTTHAIVVDPAVQALLDAGTIAVPTGGLLRALTPADDLPPPTTTTSVL